MYKFHYDVMKKTYREDFYEDLTFMKLNNEELRNHFDLSGI